MVQYIPAKEAASWEGKEIGVSDWHTVTQAQINAFADATDDHEWFHVDVERATKEMGGTIAHGFLTLSIIPHLWNQLIKITEFKGGYNYGMDKTRFTAPVKAGARIRLRATMLPVQERRGGLIIGAKCVVEVEGEERPCLVTDWCEIFYV